MNRHLVARFVSSAVAWVLLLTGVLVPGPSNIAAQQPGCRIFEETGKALCGRFLAYWQEHGGLPQQGYPVTAEFSETSEVDGKTYMVQYFERAVFELHPANEAPYDVLLSLLGSADYKRKYPNGAPGQRPNTAAGSVLFPETGKRLGGKFLDYWQRNGGLMQQGFPISDEFEERSELDGRTYTVQYFERAVFERHPENQPPYDVLLSQLGSFQYNRRYAAGNTDTLPPTPVPDLWAELRGRPLKTQPLPPDSSCPVTRASRQESAFGFDYRYGSGPIYLSSGDDVTSPGLIGADGIFDLNHFTYRDRFGGYQVKTPIIGDPIYNGQALIRGHQLDGQGVVKFEYNRGQGVSEMRLEEVNNIYTREGWYFWNTGTYFSGPGCYALQIDGLHFTDVIVLKAIKP